jgi:hypothetical protein
MKEIIVKDTAGFQLRVKKWECLSPEGLFAVNFIQATKDKDGNIDQESTYEFFMNQSDLDAMSKAITS